MPELVGCTVKGVFVLMSDAATVPAVILQDSAGRQLPIFVGLWEAVAINSAVNGEVLPRPQTHDLFLSALERYGIAINGLRIDSEENSIYYAQLDLEKESKVESLDCRPSDGIAVALRAHAPISVAEEVLAAAGSGDTAADMVDLSAFLCR